MSPAENGSHPARIAVTVRAYNVEPFVEATLRSVARQTLPDWECIVID